MPDRVLVDLHPLMVISCDALSITLLVASSELGGAGGIRILRPNKCFFFFTSFPDMNLKKDKRKSQLTPFQAIINIINNEMIKMNNLRAAVVVQCLQNIIISLGSWCFGEL